jgi:hypothetical protein
MIMYQFRFIGAKKLEMFGDGKFAGGREAVDVDYGTV